MNGRGTLRYALKVCWGFISQDIVDYKKDDLILAFQCLTQQAWWIYFSGGPQFGPPLLFVCEPSKFSKDEQFEVFEKFTCAYLFQIAREKSCDYVLIIYKKNFREETHAYHAIREKSRQQLRHSWGHARFEGERFDWPSVSFFDHWPIGMLGLLPLFALN